MNKSSSTKAQAQKYLSAGNLDKALREYEKLFSMEDVDPYDFVLAGDVHLRKGSVGQAVALYEKAVDAYERLGLYKNAAAIGKRILRLSPSLCDMHMRLGNIRVREGLTKEAVRDFLTFSEIKLQEGDLEAAISGAELACKANPEEPALAERLSTLYTKANRTVEAARELVRVSGVLREKGDEERAAATYEKALQINAEALSMPAVDEQKPDEEARPGREVVSGEVSGESVAGAGLLGPIQDEGVAEKAVPGQEGTPESSRVRDRPRARPPTVDIREVLKQFKTEVESKVSSDDYQCHYDLGVTYKEMGLHEEALNEFRIASSGERYRAKAFEMTGLCHMEMEEYEEALEAFHRALTESSREDEDYPGLCFNLGSVLEIMGRTGEALDRFQEVVALNPEFPGVSERLEALGVESKEEQ